MCKCREKQLIGGIGTPEIKAVIANLPSMGYEIHPNLLVLNNIEGLSYKLFVEFNPTTKVAHNLIIEIENEND